MTALSSRYVPLLLASLLLLMIPIARAGFGVRRVDDCVDPKALLELADLPATQSLAERYEKYDADVMQWTVAELDAAERGVQLKGALVRSFRPIDLYTRPPKVLLGKFEAGERHVERVEVAGQVLPIQTIHDNANGKNAMASYLFVYDGEPVEHPAFAQLSAAPGLVWQGTRPLSLLAVAGVVAPQKRELARAKAREWLVAAYLRHRAACSP